MYGPGNGFGLMDGFRHLGGLIAGALFTFLLVAVIVGLLILLARFLIVGTKAAQLYVNKNAPAKAAAATSTSPTPTPTPTVTKPVTKPRTPKTPPSTDL